MLVSSNKVCETANLQGVRPWHAAQHFILPLQGLHAIHMGDTVVSLWCRVPMKQAPASPRGRQERSVHCLTFRRPRKPRTIFSILVAASRLKRSSAEVVRQGPDSWW